MSVNARDRLARYEPHPGCTNMKLRALVAVNGTKQFAIYCMTPNQYGHHRRGAFIPHALVTEYLRERYMILDDVPVLYDHACEACGGAGCVDCRRESCERCGSFEYTELHHWAPRHLFDDASRWPVSVLCRECHQRWHRIVTPNMHVRKAS